MTFWNWGPRSYNNLAQHRKCSNLFFFKITPPFYTCAYIIWFKEDCIYEDLSLFVLLYNTNFTNKLKFKETKNNSLTVHIFYNLQNHPTFHSKERWGPTQQEEESALLVYLHLFCPLAFFIYFSPIFIKSVVYGTLPTGIFDSVIIACSLESISLGLVQGCKAMVLDRPA